MDYKSIRTILDADRDVLEDLVLRMACEYEKEFRHCAVLNGLINDAAVIVTANSERYEISAAKLNELNDYATARNRPAAVKVLRDATGIGLKSAVDTLDQMYPDIRKPLPELYFPDRRPTDPGYVAPKSLSELLQEQIASNERDQQKPCLGDPCPHGWPVETECPICDR